VMGYARGSGFALCLWRTPNQGHSSNQQWQVYGGAEPRLTSGGEAAA
jgi:hypothetical protein